MIIIFASKTQHQNGIFPWLVTPRPYLTKFSLVGSRRQVDTKKSRDFFSFFPSQPWTKSLWQTRRTDWCIRESVRAPAGFRSGVRMEMIIFVKRRGGVSQACDINRLHAVFIFSVQRGHTHTFLFWWPYTFLKILSLGNVFNISQVSSFTTIIPIGRSMRSRTHTPGSRALTAFFFLLNISCCVSKHAVS